MPAKPSATALPVSPEVAARIVTGSALWPPCRSPSPMSRAIVRAPTSLNESVGPWNSSSTWTPSHPPPESGTSGTGNESASRTISPSRSAPVSSTSHGVRRRVPRSGSESASSQPGARGGTCVGTKRPPSGASPARSASRNETVSPPPRVLT